MSALEDPRMSSLIAAFRADCDARRVRVLAHPDIAKRLCDHPLKLSKPEGWTGYIPPAEVPSFSGWKRNDSAVRKQLIDICKAVEQRENELEV